jgi:hypothetical protein
MITMDEQKLLPSNGSLYYNTLLVCGTFKNRGDIYMQVITSGS